MCSQLKGRLNWMLLRDGEQWKQGEGGGGKTRSPHRHWRETEHTEGDGSAASPALMSLALLVSKKFDWLWN